MGKKSKKKSKKCAGAAAATVSADGRMTEKDGRRLYDLLAFLAEIAVPVLEARRKDAQKAGYRPLGWRTFDYSVGAQGMAANSMEVLDAVMSFILDEIDWLVDEVDGKRHDAMFLQLFGRRITENDREEIRSWTVHVQDDFFYVSSRPNEGAVLVQCGRLKHFDESVMDEWHEADYHEPRVFVVRGLADSICDLVQRPIEAFRREYPAIAETYPGSTICLLNTTLLPYNGGISYMTLIKPPVGHHYRTPKDLADAAEVAVKAAGAAFDKDATVNLYRALDIKRDSHIRRLAHDPLNQQGIPTELRSTGAKTKKEAKKNSTTLLAEQMFWLPCRDRNDPRMDALIFRVCEGPRPFKLEGMKHAATQELIIDDDEVCPFHNRFALGETTPLFKDCCKDDYLRRRLKAMQKSNMAMIHLMYEPIEREEAEAISEKAALNPDSVFDLTTCLRIGYQDIGLVRLNIPPSYVSVVKRRLDTGDLFHAVLENKWIYLGDIPARMAHMGIMSMGDIELFPNGVFEGNAMTSRRLTNLIREMKWVCTGIPILGAEIEMQPSHKLKPDKEALQRNQDLLQEGLDLDVSYNIDKKENASMRKFCAYCGASEKRDGKDLSGCPCKLAYFCCVEHQQAHWPNHKEECKEARARMKADRA